MYCSTCGAYLAEGRTRCTECGTRMARAQEPPTSHHPAPRYGTEDGRWIAERAVGVCPRCTYRGEGLPYFSRGVHVAGLVGATVVTSGIMGAGGIAYYLMRREHRVCPRCGKGWGRYGEGSLAPTHAAARASTPRAPSTSRETLRRGWAMMMYVLAVIFVIGAISSGEIAAALFGVAAGTGGWALQRSANRARDQRRAALLEQMQLSVLQLAGERGGRLTVTEVSAALGWSLNRAEKVLSSIDDGLRVNSEVSDEGVIIYEFREVLHDPRRLAGGNPPQRTERPPRLGDG